MNSLLTPLAAAATNNIAPHALASKMESSFRKPENSQVIGYNAPCPALAFTDRRLTASTLWPAQAFPQNGVETGATADEILVLYAALMNTINREELKQKLDRREEFMLINCLDEWMFREKRIPGSIRFERTFLSTLNPKGEVIVYCSNPSCTNSVLVYQQFAEHGFQNLWHYPGGIADWEDGGYPMEGEGVE